METIFGEVIRLLTLVALGGAAGAFVKLVAPLLREKLKGEKRKYLEQTLNVLVEAAEQMYHDCAGKIKKDAVQNWIKRYGLEASNHDIESAVLRMHADGYAYEDAHGIIPEYDDILDAPDVGGADTGALGGGNAAIGGGTHADRLDNDNCAQTEQAADDAEGSDSAAAKKKYAATEAAREDAPTFAEPVEIAKPPDSAA
jgi:hypothetical protein